MIWSEKSSSRLVPFQKFASAREVLFHHTAPATSDPPGYAFVVYQRHDNAARAIVANNGILVGGRQIRCSWGKEKDLSYAMVLSSCSTPGVSMHELYHDPVALLTKFRALVNLMEAHLASHPLEDPLDTVHPHQVRFFEWV